MAIQTFKLWKAALPSANPNSWSGLPVFMGKMEGETFFDAVANYVSELPEASQGLYSSGWGMVLPSSPSCLREVRGCH